MRITFVLPFAGLQGGIRVLAIYADHLARRGHKVVVISTPPTSSTRSKLKSFLFGRGWQNHRETSYFEGINVEHRVLEEVRPVTDLDVPDADVVMATYYTTAYGVQNLSPAKGAKAIFIQGYEVENNKSNPKLDATWRMPMHKIVISKWLVQLAREKFGDEVVSLVPNSVDLGQFHAAPREKRRIPTIGFLHHNNPLKGCSTSLKVLKRVKTVMPSLRVISFGAEHPDFMLRLPYFMEFYYRPPQEKIKELYAQCDAWLSCSTREGFSLTLIEAMACRCPVVSTRSGGPMDIIEEGVNGYLADVGDVEALADRVLRVLNLPQERWLQMSEAAYGRASSFTWEDSADLLEQALDLTIERNRRCEFSDGRRH